MPLQEDMLWYFFPLSGIQTFEPVLDGLEVTDDVELEEEEELLDEDGSELTEEFELEEELLEEELFEEELLDLLAPVA